MRVSDSMLSSKFLSTVNDLKVKMEKLNKEITTSKKIHVPSDSPTGMAKLLSLNNRINHADIYASNIQESRAFVNQTVTSMEAMQNEIGTTLMLMTEIKDPSKVGAYASYADKIDSAINNLIATANSDFDGKYIFGGTDFSSVPFGFTGDNKSVEVKVNDVSSKHSVKISANLEKKINTTGTELFGTIVKQSGIVDSNTIVGGTVTGSTTIYDAEGNAYTLNTTYTKTAANNYDLTYDIVNGGGVTVYSSPQAVKVAFNSSTGKLLTIDGSDNKSFNIKSASNKIDFMLDLSGTNESNAASSLNYAANQKKDIFNTLIAIRDSLKNGQLPNEEDITALNSFNNHILDKLSENGNLLNQLDNSYEMISNQKNLLDGLAAKENEVDIAKAVLDLQNQDYLLQLAYKVSSMVLPKSLLDFL